MSMRFVSLGFACNVATQIRAHTGVHQSYFFDWLMSPRESLDVLFRPASSLLLSGRWDLVNDDTSVRDLDTGLMFMHEFPSAPSPVPGQPRQMIASQVEHHLPSARAKFNHLRQKTLALLRERQDLVLVRAVECDGPQALEELNVIRRLFLPLNPSLRFVLASSRLDRHAAADDSLLFKTAPSASWAGDPASWLQLFQTAEQLFDVPGRAPASTAAPATELQS